MAPEKAEAPSAPMCWKDRLAAWIGAQEFNNVLLLGILAAICYGFWFAMTTAVPMHLKQIQEGYDRAEASHRAERDLARDTHSKQIERIVGGFEKAIERDRALMQHLIDQSRVEKFERASK